MDIKIIDSSIEADSQKLYTQGEVDDLLDGKMDKVPTPVDEVATEQKASLKRKRRNNKAIAKLVKKSNRILVSLSSHAFPFDLFPNTVNIEEGRITVINRHFMSSEVHSVDIKNIANVFIYRTILYAQLVIISNTFEDNEIKIRNLRPKEAIHARRIIEGLRVFHTKQIDTSGYTSDELISKLQELSTTEIVT